MEVIDNSGRNALIESSANNDSDIVETLLVRKARLNQQDKLGRSALIEACAEGHSVVVFQLLATRGVTPLEDTNSAIFSSEFIANEGETPMNVYPDDENKLNLNLQDWDGRTALICACEEGYIGIALALIRAGAVLNITSKMNNNPCDKSFGRTALIEACERGLRSVVEALIAAGADLNMCDTRGRSPLVSACVWGHDEIAKGIGIVCENILSTLCLI